MATGVQVAFNAPIVGGGSVRGGNRPFNPVAPYLSGYQGTSGLAGVGPTPGSQAGINPNQPGTGAPAVAGYYSSGTGSAGNPGFTGYTTYPNSTAYGPMSSLGGVNPTPGSQAAINPNQPGPTASMTAAPTQATPGAATQGTAVTLPPGVPRIAPYGTPNSQLVPGQLLEYGPGAGVYYNTGTRLYQNADGSVTGNSPGSVIQYVSPADFIRGGYAPQQMLQNQLWASQQAYGGAVPADSQGNPAWSPLGGPVPIGTYPGVLSAPGPPPLANSAVEPYMGQFGGANAGPGQFAAPGQAPAGGPNVVGLPPLPTPISRPQPQPQANAPQQSLSIFGSANPQAQGQAQGQGLNLSSLASLLSLFGIGNPSQSALGPTPFGIPGLNSDQSGQFMQQLMTLLGIGNYYQGLLNNYGSSTGQAGLTLPDLYAQFGPPSIVRQTLYPTFP